MKKILFVIFILLLGVASRAEVIWSDSLGLIIEIKEEMGGHIRDTGTVVSLVYNDIIVTHKDNGITIYPKGNLNSIKLIKKFSTDKTDKQTIKF